MSGRTPSDEAVERGASYAYAVSGATVPWADLPERTRNMWRAVALPVLVAAFPSGEQPGGEEPRALKDRAVEIAARAQYEEAKCSIVELEDTTWDTMPEVDDGEQHPGMYRAYYREQVTTAIEALARAHMLSSSEYRRAISDVVEEVMEAQADLQMALGLIRLDQREGRLPGLDSVEDRLSRSLARLHELLASLGRPMYDPATHPEIERLGPREQGEES